MKSWSAVTVTLFTFCFLFVQTQKTRILSFGKNDEGELGLGNINKIQIKNVTFVVSWLHTIFVTSNQTVYGLGDNGFGQLGLDDTLARSEPVLLPITGIIQASVGQRHSLFLTKLGQVMVTGSNGQGQLGFDDSIQRNVPVLNPFLADIIQLASGRTFSLFLNKDNQLFSCGTSFAAGLGNVQKKIPTLLSYLPNVVSISSRFTHSLALTKSGQVYSCGSSARGGLGLGVFNTSASNFTLIPNLGDIGSISAGDDYSLFLTKSNQVYSVGGNDYGQLGLNDKVNRFIPTLVPLDYKITKISAGKLHSFIISNDSDVYGFGYNLEFNLGLPDNIDRLNATKIETFYKTKSAIAGESRSFVITDYFFEIYFIGKYQTGSPFDVDLKGLEILDICSGNGFASVLTKSNTIYSFGKNDYGQLGLGDNTTRMFPTLIPNFFATKISCEESHVLTMNSGNQIFSHGLNTGGSLGVGDLQNRFSPTLVPFTDSVKKIYASDGMSAILTNDGKIYFFGQDSGQLFQNVTFILTPTLLTTFSNISDLSCFDNACFLLITNGDLFVMGFNTGLFFGFSFPNNVRTGPLLVPTISNVKKVLLSSSHTLVINNIGDVYSFGTGAGGRLGIGNVSDQIFPQKVPIDNALDIQITREFSYVLRNDNSLYVFGRNIGGYSLSNLPNSTLTPTFTGLKNVNLIRTSRRNGFSASYVVITCKEGYTGANCDTPLCFGLTNLSPLVCSGLGFCKDYDTCECLPGIVGDKCEASVYIWKGGSSNYKDTSRWLSEFDGIRKDFLSYPTQGAIKFEQPGSYEVTFDKDLSLDLEAIYVGSASANVKLNFIGNNIKFNKIYVHPGSSITSIDSTFTVKNIRNNTNPITGTFTNSNIIGGRIQFNSTRVIGDLSLLDTTITNSESLILSESNIISKGRSQIINNGRIDILSNSTNSSASVTVHNYGIIQINGKQTTNVKEIVTYKGSKLTLDKSRLKVENGLNVTSGIIKLGGYLETPLFTFSSSEGFLDLVDDLIIQGNASFLETSTIYLQVNGTKDIDINEINVQGHLILNPFILINVNQDYANSLKVSDRLPFLKYKTIQKSADNIMLLGIPQRNAKTFYENNELKFEIIFSFGTIDSKGYDCHYLGNKKNLEMNYYQAQQKIMLTLTFPSLKSDNHVGFGFDINGNISNSILVLGNQDSFKQYHHNSNITNPLIITTQINTNNPGLFLLGTKTLGWNTYYTINLFVSTSLLINQSKIYYSEIPNPNRTQSGNVTNVHYFEVYDFKVMKSAFEINKDVLQCTNFLQPTRAEIYDLGATVPILVLYIVLFFLCLVVCRYRPMNTRGLSPYLTLFFLFLQLILEIRNYFEIPVYQGSLCVFYAYGIYPLQQICFVMILLYFWRYFSIINLNENKKNIYQSIRIGKDIGRFILFKSKVLKFISSAFFSVCLLSLTFIFSIIINTIILGSYKYQCKFETLIALKIVHSISLAFIYLLTLISLVSDIIGNYDLVVKFHWIQYIFYNDPYYFRTQILLFSPFMIFTLAVEIFFIITSDKYESIVRYFQTGIVLNTITFSILLLLEVIFPLVLTFYELIFILIKKTKKKDQTEVFVNLMENKEVKDMFVEFCKREYALENVSFYEDIQKYKATLSGERSIVEKYLSGTDSPMEVNCSKKAIAELTKKIENKELTKDLFYEVEKECLSNLSDTYSRFVYSEKYEKYKKNHENEKAMVEGKI